LKFRFYTLSLGVNPWFLLLLVGEKINGVFKAEKPIDTMDAPSM